MESPPDVVATLVRLYAQSFALAFLFAGCGHFILRKLLPPSGEGGIAWRWAAGYFLGISAFFPVFLFGSRIAGARAALWIAIAAMLALTVVEIKAAVRAGRSWRGAARAAAGCVVLVALYSFTDVALWLRGFPTGEVALLDHFGSIHAGRYANYAVFIADHGRVPFLGQNGGQSMLASTHLLLGLDRPLAALAVWLPVSLAFMTMLLFGILRSAGFPALRCAAAALMVMFCNVSVSSIHVLLFDNGSPLAFIGYTDMAIAVGTFFVFCEWARRQMLADGSQARRHLLLPALLGLTWTWYAPQNLVIGAAAVALAALAWKLRYAKGWSARPLVEAAGAFALAAVVGATQFGGFLPQSLREDTGYWVQEVKPTLAVRPYIQFLRNHWTVHHWNEQPGVYESLYRAAQPVGRDEVYREFAWVAEQNLWASLRIYGFVLLGLALLFATLRRARAAGDALESWRPWWLLSLAGFGTGYAFTYVFELDGWKWWATRFLVPGVAMALACFALAGLEGMRRAAGSPWRFAWVALFAAAVFGPVMELVAVSYRNFVLVANSDPIGRRIEALATRRGPLLFESFQPNPEIARKEAHGVVLVGVDGRSQGLVMETLPLPLARGRYRMGFRIDGAEALAPDASFVRLDLAGADDPPVASRVIRANQLERRGERQWATMEFELPAAAKGVRLRLWSTSDAKFKVVTMRLERQ